MALLLSQLVKRYVGPDGSVVPVIDIEHFSLADGEQIALVGSSGSGKTTLLNLIAGILTPDSGKIRFDLSIDPEQKIGRWTRALPYILTAGTAALFLWMLKKEDEFSRGGESDASQSSRKGVDIVRLNEAERDIFRGENIGYIFQTHHLLPGFTALENVLLGMSFTGRSHDRGWATHLLEEVGLADRLHYKPEKLSVGQQQRVAVARALANRPKLVLGDEPTGALDAANAQQVLSLIMQLCTEVGASLLLVSHDPAITQRLPKAVSLAELNRASNPSLANSA